MPDTAPHKDIHGKVTPAAHQQWRDATVSNGISITALCQALAPDLADILAERPEIVTDTRAIDAARRYRTNNT